ncbi:MAG: hypothetical protein ACRC14_16175 [Paracoccaceae bacterium]
MAELPLIHIGMAKAASTFLQLELFPTLPTVLNLGKLEVSDELKTAGASIVRRTSLTWNSIEDTLAAPFRKGLEEARETGRRAVWSNEDLSVYKFLDPETMARRVRRVFGPHDTLFILRDPFTWLTSHYLFRLQNQNPVAVFGFEHWLTHHFASHRIGSDVAEIAYAHLARLYRDSCGGQLHILPYELLKTDKLAFAYKLGEVLQTDPNPILDALNAERKNAAHKIRITADQEALFETFRWIEMRHPGRFVQEVQATAERAGRPIAAKDQATLAEIATTPDAAPPPRAAAAAVLHAIARRWPRDTPPANPGFTEPQVRQIRHMALSNLATLKRDFGFDLAAYGLTYGAAP